MTANVDRLAEALKLPSGAHFHRCALQVNPHHYSESYRGKPAEGDAAAHAKAVIEKAVEVGISVLAVTDHNSVSGVSLFQDAAKPFAIEVFPGFELSSSEGVHILCIYPQDSGNEKLGRFLGEFGVTNTTPCPDPCKKSFTEILEMVAQQGGITVAAHVTNESGLFKVLTGKPCIQAWQSEQLLAIQIPGSIEALPQESRQIVLNKNAEYRRMHVAEEELAITVINARDVVNPEDLEDRSASCWIKMSEVSIEGLRQAFLDPGSRVRLNPNEGSLVPEQHAELVALTWETGGFLDGAAVHFNSNLNVLVGGRGAGKSTVIESIRCVLGLDAIGDEARKVHAEFVQKVLRSGTKISLLLRVHRPAVREYRIERTIPNPPFVRDDQGGVSTLSPRDVLPLVEVYGQHEVSELAKSREKRTRLLDRFVEPDETLPRRKAELRRELEKNRRGLIDAQSERLQVEERLAALPGLEETLKGYREAGLEERLKEQSYIVREERVLSSIPERLAPFHEMLESLKREIPIDRVFLSPKALEDLPGRSILEKANEIITQLDQDFSRIVKELEQALKRANQGIAAISDQWQDRKKQVQTEYEKILRGLQKSRIDGEEFIKLRRQIEDLRPLRERQVLVQRLEKEQAERRRGLLSEWEDIKAEELRRLERAAKKVNRRLRDKIQVEVTAAGDREPFFRMLRDDIGGRLAEAIESLAHRQALSLTQFVEACRAGTDALKKLYGITPTAADRLARAEPEIFMKIEELDLPCTTDISLNTAPAGEPPSWQVLDELSTGQKATAVLLLLLLESEAPLIVDQPEDDLDNRFITEGVVPRMREEKQRRQFIFSTHNANIPVLGDAELIVGLSASGEAEHGRARMDPNVMGSIDATPVRELLEEILEGGKEAFERRRRKYGF